MYGSLSDIHSMNGSENMPMNMLDGRLLIIYAILYVIVHGKTNHIALGLNLRYEPHKSPGVIIIDFDILV